MPDSVHAVFLKKSQECVGFCFFPTEFRFWQINEILWWKLLPFLGIYGIIIIKGLVASLCKNLHILVTLRSCPCFGFCAIGFGEAEASAARAFA